MVVGGGGGESTVWLWRVQRGTLHPENRSIAYGAFVLRQRGNCFGDCDNIQNTNSRHQTITTSVRVSSAHNDGTINVN